MNFKWGSPLTADEMEAVRRLIREHIRIGPLAEPRVDMEQLAESNRAVIEQITVDGDPRFKGLIIEDNPLVKGLIVDAD